MRRVAVTLLTVVVAVAGAIGLIAFFQARDEGDIGDQARNDAGPGVAAPGENDPRLQAGNVILTYRRTGDGPVLRALAEDVAGPPDKVLEDAGQAVIVLRRPHQTAGPVVAHAAGRRLVANTAQDPQVRAFVEYWLGRAAG